MTAMGLLAGIRDFIAPDICPMCGVELANPDVRLCDDCYGRFPLLPEKRCPGCGGPGDSLMKQCRECLDVEERPWQIAVSAFVFDDLARTAIHRLKYRGRRELAPFFAAHLAENWRKYADGFSPDAITPVPLHWWRRFKRGYNQSGEVAWFLSKELGIPFMKLLKRVKYTKAQVTLDAQKRVANLKSAFAGSEDARGKRVLIVDDVFTTGATLTAAAKALLKQKARGVAVITIARDL